MLWFFPLVRFNRRGPHFPLFMVVSLFVSYLARPEYPTWNSSLSDVDIRLAEGKVQKRLDVNGYPALSCLSPVCFAVARGVC